MSFRCSGCKNPFARRGDYIQHLRKSTRQDCIVAARTVLETLQLPIRHDPPTSHRQHPANSSSRKPSSAALDTSDSPSGSSAGASSHETCPGVEPPPQIFEGDFFGADYTDEDFPMGEDVVDVNNAHPVEVVSDSDLDDSEDEALLPRAFQREAVVPVYVDSNSDATTPVRAPAPASLGSLSPTEVPAGTPPNPIPVVDDATAQFPTDTSDDVEPPSPLATQSGPGGVSPDAHEQLRTTPGHIQHFGGAAGRPVSTSPQFPTSGYHGYGGRLSEGEDNPYAPFKSRLDWEMAHWAKSRGSGSTAFTDLLAIEGIVEALGLSYTNSAQLNAIIDEKLPQRRPAFKLLWAETMGERFPLYARDILECVKALYGDPEHAHYLCFAPERHYADADKTVRLYHDLHTGKWWWSTQKQLEADNPGATVVPIILSSDKTQVTLFRNKTAYPVYLTIGNLPKSIRRKPSRQGQILLAYLPTTRLENVTNKAQRRRILTNLFHACVGRLVEPLKKAGVQGIVLESGDGIRRRCHPILAVYVGDYPEQCLVTGAFTGDCPTCTCPHDDLECLPPCPHPYRDLEEVLDALEELGSADYVQTCRNAHIKPVQHPFWQDLPYVDIFQSITPDILHQLYQGVFKHLIDARVRSLPPNHSVRVFHKGISMLTRVTGTEHKQISHFLLGLIVDAQLPDRSLLAPLLRSSRALLDFLYIAQYPSHTDTTLAALDDALATFHANRDVFVELGIRVGFNIPKLHFLLHYVRAIKLFGTTDNYNTEATERLHIDFAKEAYRATNHKDELPQMTKWLERREKIAQHANYVAWRVQQSTATIGPASISAHRDLRWQPPDMACQLHVKMTRHPTRKAVPLADIISDSHYGATFFIPALARFVAQFNNPSLTLNQIEERAADVLLPVSTLPVYHKIKFWNNDVYGASTLDSIKAYPSSRRRPGSDVYVPARFDTALVRVRSGPDGERSTSGSANGLQGMRVGRVRVVFALPDRARDRLFPQASRRPPSHLAYVEWLSRIPAHPDPHSRMYKVKRLSDGQRVASVLPVMLIERSVHLIPKWGGPIPSHWTSENVLDECTTFFLNPFKDAHTYYNVY
ncbi:hypothetical protein BV20DRAFT_944964 [Pilatotrama ljubarskyi]|nr:hypothetical protein BV20DRAFT_944964 [Pilatotrama ljubarskyi]